MKLRKQSYKIYNNFHWVVWKLWQNTQHFFIVRNIVHTTANNWSYPNKISWNFFKSSDRIKWRKSNLLTTWGKVIFNVFWCKQLISFLCWFVFVLFLYEKHSKNKKKNFSTICLCVHKRRLEEKKNVHSLASWVILLFIATWTSVSNFSSFFIANSDRLLCSNRNILRQLFQV